MGTKRANVAWSKFVTCSLPYAHGVHFLRGDGIDGWKYGCKNFTTGKLQVEKDVTKFEIGGFFYMGLFSLQISFLHVVLAEGGVLGGALRKVKEAAGEGEWCLAINGVERNQHRLDLEAVPARLWQGHFQAFVILDS